MIQTGTALTAFAATITVLGGYLYVGLRSRATDRRDYYIGGQSVGADDYATTSVGYALQMAAVFLFSYWALLYGVGALWAAAFWMIGYWLLYWLLPRFLDFHSQPLRTLHEYIAQRHNGGRFLRQVAATATILGLGGAMMAEVDYVLMVFAPLGLGPSAVSLCRFGFVFFGAAYIVLSGFKAEVGTERWQLPVAYAGLFAALIWLIPLMWTTSNAGSFWTVVALSVAALAGLVSAKQLTRKERAFFPLQTWVLLLAGGALLLTVYWATNFLPSGDGGTVLNSPITKQLGAQGFLGVASLFLANVLWMPIDLSTWQRIASVKPNSGSMDTLQRLRIGTRRILLESPLSWVLGACLGLAIGAAGILPAGADPGTAISSFATRLASTTSPLWPHWSTILFYALFVAGCMSVMISTVNGIVSAISFTTERDMLPEGGASDGRLGPARAVALGVLAMLVLGYEALVRALGSNLAPFLYSAYAAQLALVPAVFLALLGKRQHKRAAIASVLFGLTGAVVSYFLAVQVKDPAVAAQVAVLPPILSILLSVAGYFLFYRGPKVDGT